MSRSAPPASVRDLRRGQIVVAARAIVAREGLDALTFAALERELGYTRGVVTWHFRNKEEIVRAALEDAVEDIDRAATAAVVAEPTFADRARTVVREMVRGWLASDAGPVVMNSWSRLANDADAAEANASMYRRYRQMSAELVRRGVERGEFRADADPEGMGAVLVGLVLGIALQELFERGGVDVDRAVRLAGDAVVAHLAPAARRPAGVDEKR